MTSNKNWIVRLIMQAKILSLIFMTGILNDEFKLQKKAKPRNSIIVFSYPQ